MKRRTALKIRKILHSRAYRRSVKERKAYWDGVERRQREAYEKNEAPARMWRPNVYGLAVPTTPFVELMARRGNLATCTEMRVTGYQAGYSSNRHYPRDDTEQWR